MEAAAQLRKDLLLTVQPRAVEAATEMFNKRDKDENQLQRQAEEIEKMRRQWEFLCICLTQRITKVHGLETKSERKEPVQSLMKAGRKFTLKSFIVSV